MTKTQFRGVVVFSLLLLFIAGVVVLTFSDTLPPELSTFVEAEFEEEPTAVEFLGFAVVVLTVIGNIGLLFFAWWSRPLFAAGVVAASVATVFDGPVVTTAPEAFIFEMGLLLDGFMIALAYFSEAKVYFERKAT